jgi:hypothetical protein
VEERPIAAKPDVELTGVSKRYGEVTAVASVDLEIASGEATLPIWIFTNLSRPNQLPIVDVVAVFVILLSIIPVYFANRLTQTDEGVGGRPGGGGATGSASVAAEGTAVP